MLLLFIQSVTTVPYASVGSIWYLQGRSGVVAQSTHTRALIFATCDQHFLERDVVLSGLTEFELAAAMCAADAQPMARECVLDAGSLVRPPEGMPGLHLEQLVGQAGVVSGMTEVRTAYDLP